MPRDAEAYREYQAKWRREQRQKFPEQVRAEARARYQKNKEKIIQRVMAYHSRNRDEICEKKKARYRSHDPDVRRVNARQKRYGLSEEAFQALMDVQSGLCAICGSAGPLDVDHDHATERVRGLLCHRCNKGLGLFKDDPKRLKSAVQYILGKGKKK